MGPLSPHPDDDMRMNMERKLTAEHQSVWENPVPVPLCSPTDTTLPLDCTWTSRKYANDKCLNYNTA